MQPSGFNYSSGQDYGQGGGPVYPAVGGAHPAYGAQPPAYGAQPAYVSQPQAYVSQSQAGQTTVVVVQPGETGVSAMGGSRTAVRTQCPHCLIDVTTEMEYSTGTGSYVIGAFLCSMGCCCLAWLPCYMQQCKDAIHHCPQCKREIGRYQPPSNSRRNRHNRH